MKHQPFCAFSFSTQLAFLDLWMLEWLSAFAYLIPETDVESILEKH
jgi:hypothetical protein